MTAKISKEEVAQVLRKVLSGEVRLKLSDPKKTWDGSFAGNVGFCVDGWTIVIFNDCDEIDYIDNVVSPDGRSSEFGDWGTDEQIGCPLNLLTNDEMLALEFLVKAAR